MIRRVVPRMIAIAMFSTALASHAAAQLGVEVSASIGRYAPLGSFAPAGVYSTSLPTSPSDLSGTALGGALRVWVSPRIGIGITGSSVSSTIVGGFTPGGLAPNTPARVSTATVQLLYRLIEGDHRAPVWLGVGGAAVRHGGAAYEPFGNPVNFGGVAEIGSAIRLVGPLSAELGVTTIVYRMNMRGAPTTKPPLTERGTQIDAQFHTGLSVGWR
jgi:hypothetical protein